MGCMQWLKRHLTEVFCVLLLTVIVALVAVSNYTQGTFLTGIDNFHIEFDLQLAWSRAWNGVWQENQGVGIVSGLAQMTELPRVAIYQILIWVMPMNLIRYTYVFGNLYLGVIGVFFLVWYLSKSRLAGLAGALFYLFNLGTLQVFFMPTEMFVVNYAALPWLFLLVFKYLSEGKRASLWWYAGLLFIFAPMAMTPTIFVVYLLFLGIACVGHKWKRVMGVVGVTLGMSMYFLLPFANFALNNAKILTESKVNSVFSQENYLMNAERTSWGDLATLKGMWFDYPDNVAGKLMPLLGAWDDYLKHVGIWGYAPMIVMTIGAVVMLWKRRWQGIVVVGMGVVGWVLLRGENQPFGGVVATLRSLPLVAEAFRTPYTKIAPILMVIYAVTFGCGVYMLGQIWSWRKGKLMWKELVIIGVAIGLIWLNRPYFYGDLISEGVRINIPNEYFEIFKFFKSQDKQGRIMELPIQTSQAWKYTDWGYRGSGFLWYGIGQPILDRAFDVWSPYNEGFYNQFANALYSCNPARSDLVGVNPTRSDLGEQRCKEQVVKVLQKYDVRYVLLDESVIAPGQDKEILRIEETKKLAGELGWERVFNENFLTVWKVPVRSDLVGASPTRSDLGGQEQGVSAPDKFTWVSADTSKVRRDVVYDELGTYVERQSDGGTVYPFAQLTREEVGGATYGEQGITLVSTPVGIATGSHLEVPGWREGEAVEVQYSARLESGNLRVVWEPAYLINGIPGPKLASVEIPTKLDYAWVKVGEGEAVFVESGKEVRGRARLAVGEALDIRLYDGVVSREESPEGWQEKWRQICGEHKELDCYAMRLSSPNTESLLQTVSPYEGQGLEVCLDLEGEPYGCANVERRGVSPIVNTLTVQKGERYWLDYVVAHGGAMPVLPSVRWYPLVENLTLESGIWEEFLHDSRFEIQGSSVEVEVPGTPRIYDMSILGRARITNCDVLSRGTAEKAGSEYIADERGAACDYSELAGISTDLPYLMRLSGENIAGRSVKVFLFNQGSKRNDLEYLLGKRVFDQSFALLVSSWASLYTLNTETRSFGELAKNTLNGVEVRYLPLLQIAGARVGKSEATVSTLKVGEVKKTGTWLYLVRVEGEGLLRLSQGYDKGWISWGLEHVKVDGWANGWIIPSARSVILFYWPQLLEYLGFGILGVTIVWIVKYKG